MDNCRGIDLPTVAIRKPWYAFTGVSTAPPTATTLEEKVHHIMTTLQNSLEENDLSWDNVTMMCVFVRDMSNFGRVNAIYQKFFGINPPPR